MNTTLSQKQQRGLSLVELMVSITISLVLMLGISQIFLSSKASYNLQDGVARMQENARFALDIISRSVGIAGYRPDGLGEVIDILDNTKTLENESQNYELEFTIGSGKASDVIAINHASPVNCLGAAVANEVTDVLYIEGTDLVCKNIDNTVETTGVMAEGIENMQILYGEDTDNDAIANVYVGANNIVDWNTVVSIRVSLLVSTNGNVGSKDTKTHGLLNTPSIGPIEDNVMRRVFTRTILFRNVA